MSIYTLRNSLHGTSVNVRCDGVQHIYDEVVITPTKRQWRRIERTLCGMSDCTCGGIRSCDPQTHEKSKGGMRWTARIRVDPKHRA